MSESACNSLLLHSDHAEVLPNQTKSEVDGLWELRLIDKFVQGTVVVGPLVQGANNTLINN